jgi:hypothetical protein
MEPNQVCTPRGKRIRDLIRPDVEAPIRPLGDQNERRHYHRYDGHDMPGELVTRVACIPVTCIDIGYGGVRVLTRSTASLRPGQRVLVRIPQYATTFTDEFSVRRTTRTPDGISIHLAL